MRLRTFYLLLVFVVMGIMATYLVLSSSYQRSLQSKVYYYMGDYVKAQKLAKQAHEENPYNRMAATVMTQSGLALEYLAYISEGKTYLASIKAMTQGGALQKADKIRIKFMAEIMIERFPKLTPTVMIDKALSAEVKKLYDEFQAIHEKITRAL